MQQQALIINPVKSDIKQVILGIVSRSNGKPVMIAPGIAQRILDEMNFEGQRKISIANLAKHQRRISKGLWKGSFPITIAILKNGDMWLVDGQHRLTAIANQISSLPVTIIIAAEETEHDVRFLYAGFDEKSGKRTINDVLSAVGLGAELDLPKAYTARLFNALPILRNGLEPYTGGSVDAEKYIDLHGIDSRLSSLSEWSSEAKKYLLAVNKTTGKIRTKMVTAGMMAVALYTFRYQPAKAHEFWHGLAENDGLKRDDPRASLLRDMIERSANTGANRQTTQAPALAWNAFCTGRSLKIIKCITGAQITLWGTPLGTSKK